tara:strand:- start:78 stop:548 length:471 start_codon:yes stop_codon:yes gene_type:complete
MVADIKVKVNTIEVTNYLKKISRRSKGAMHKALSNVSNMATLMITKRTQSGKLPDGGQMRPYAKSTKQSRSDRGRQVGFVDLTDTGKMFRSLDFKVGGNKSSLFFSNMERAKIASYHDFFGVGKKKVKRPFFAIGNKEEDKLREQFKKVYFGGLRI